MPRTKTTLLYVRQGTKMRKNLKTSLLRFRVRALLFYAAQVILFVFMQSYPPACKVNIFITHHSLIVYHPHLKVAANGGAQAIGPTKARASAPTLHGSPERRARSTLGGSVGRGSEGSDAQRRRKQPQR